MVLDKHLPQITHAEVILRLLTQMLNRRSQQIEHLWTEHAWQLVQTSRFLLSLDTSIPPATSLSRLLKFALVPLSFIQMRQVLALHYKI